MLTAFQAAATTPAATSTAQATATATASPTSTVAATTPVTLCVGVMPLQQSTDRGQVAEWEVGAWTEGGNVPDARLQLTATAGVGAPTFSFGCASGNGTSACDLGAVDSTSAQRLFEAVVTVPLTATTINSVSLSATGSAANLAMDPVASTSIAVLAASSPSSAPATLSPGGIAFPTPSPSASGNAAGLFPTVAPSSTTAANVSSISGSPIGSEIAEVAGLAALAAAMVLAVTRLSFRRPPARHAANSSAATPPVEAPTELTSNPTDRSAGFNG